LSHCGTDQGGSDINRKDGVSVTADMPVALAGTNLSRLDRRYRLDGDRRRTPIGTTKGIVTSPGTKPPLSARPDLLTALRDSNQPIPKVPGSTRRPIDNVSHYRPHPCTAAATVPPRDV
jgi:hypothetical protein